MKNRGATTCTLACPLARAGGGGALPTEKRGAGGGGALPTEKKFRIARTVEEVKHFEETNLRK